MSCFWSPSCNFKAIAIVWTPTSTQHSHAYRHIGEGLKTDSISLKCVQLSIWIATWRLDICAETLCVQFIRGAITICIYRFFDKYRNLNRFHYLRRQFVWGQQFSLARVKFNSSAWKFMDIREFYREIYMQIRRL